MELENVRGKSPALYVHRGLMFKKKKKKNHKLSLLFNNQMHKPLLPKVGFLSYVLLGILCHLVLSLLNIPPLAGSRTLEETLFEHDHFLVFSQLILRGNFNYSEDVIQGRFGKCDSLP